MTQETAGRTRPWWLIIGSAVAVLLAGAYVLLAAWQSTAAPSGAQSMGVDIGGMDREQAATALTDGLGETPQQEVAVVAGESSATFDPEDAGLGVDIDATVDSALGFSLDPRVVWSRLFEDEEIAPVLDIDEDALGPVLESTAEDLTLEPVDAQLEYDEDRAAIVTKGEDGIVVADAALREAIEQQWLRADEVTVDPVATEPDITTEEAERVRSDVAEPAVSDAVTLEATDPDGETQEMEVPAQTIAGLLSFEPQDGTLAPVLDAGALTEAVFEANPDVGQAPTDASFDIDGDDLTVVPASSGLGAEEDAVADAVAEAMTADDRSGEIELTEEEPEFTTEDAEDADFSDTIAEFSTSYDSDPNRDTNLRVSTDRVRGTVLLPGEQFSLNETLGQRTAANGYKPAGVIMDGQMKEDYGGGISQVSTTLFNAAFFAGFDLDEHRAHSRYISRYPEGRETTIDWTSIDLKFTNTSDEPVVLDMSLSGGEVHARVLGVKTVEVEAGASDRFAYTSPGTVRESGPSCTPQSPGEGWSITIYRTIRDADSGDVVQEDDFTTVYRPVNRVVCED
ncbi:VanW family protein [Brevibacterium senegalense]|uniref:VanW family protein n=1 Tax=Brevibacterium senegalense TaxID=1033736 RepID=UPI00037E6629|nr:VanW family protein [Brevibacterium senegalense]